MKEVVIDKHLVRVANEDGIGYITFTVDEAEQLIRDLKPAIIKARLAEKLLAKEQLKSEQELLTQKMQELENLKRRVGQLREKSK